MEVKLIAEKGENSLLHKAYVITNVLKEENNKKIFLGNNTEKVCRFCGKDSSKTSFKKKAHIIPEFMGNKFCFSNFECDTCNEYFGTLEDSLSNLGGILNSFSTIKGKKGYSKYKGNKEGLEVLAKNSNEVVIRTNDDKKGKTFILDNNNKKVKFDTNQYAYIPQDAYKTLVKIGLCMLEESELFKYKGAIKWIMQPKLKNYESHPFFNVFRKVGGEKRFLKPLAILMKKRNNLELPNFPQHTLILFYGIIQYQIFLPFHEEDKLILSKQEVVFPLEEHLITDQIINGIKTGISVEAICLDGTQRLKNEKHKFSFDLK